MKIIRLHLFREFGLQLNLIVDQALNFKHAVPGVHNNTSFGVSAGGKLLNEV